MRAMHTTHGETHSPEHRTWNRIKVRCFNERSAGFRNYGGRGITMCPEWVDSFPKFLEHVGRKPTPEHTIERIDNDRGYEPGNVRWATPKEQANNRRSSVWMTYRGQTKTLGQWADEMGVNHSTLFMRLERGWSHEKTLSTPLIKSVLSAEQVREVRSRYRGRGKGVSMRALAKEYGVSVTTIWQALGRRKR